MKIALVVDIYNDKGNGTSISARRFVDKLQKAGNDVNILCQGEIKGQDGNMFYFETKKVPLFQKICEQQHAILAVPDDALIEKALEGVDIVHIYLPFWLGTRTAQIAKNKGIPVLSCYHISAENITFNIGLRNMPYANDITYALLHKIHFKEDVIGDIYCPSPCIANRIIEAGYKQNIHIISNGYNEAFKQKKVEKPIKYKNKIVITSVGRLTREKRQDLIINAISLCRCKSDIVLILAGKGGKQKEYEKLAAKKGVNLEIVFLNQQELIETLNYSDLFIQASDVETESISCLEAIACGVVPIISNAKMCATKQFALIKQSLFEHGDAKDLAERIDEWLSNPEMLKAYRNNYAQSAKSYNIDKSIKAIMNAYKFIIDNNGKAYGLYINYNNPNLSRENGKTCKKNTFLKLTNSI